jgi:glycine dehydrogenase
VHSVNAQPSTPPDTFPRRHIGPGDDESAAMLRELGFASIDELIDRAVPASIRLKHPLDLPEAKGERQALAELKAIASRNAVLHSHIGAGYYPCVTPPVIQRNILENPGWYTAYTPYQAEIAQGRLEALINFQTMVTDLTAMDIANASLLDEATAAGEAMAVCFAARRNTHTNFFVSDSCHPQTIAVVKTRAKPLGITVTIGDERETDFATTPVFGALMQYPATDGEIRSYDSITQALHAHGALAVVAADILALTLLRPPGEWGADIAVGNTQRFGVPLGFGGPHAAFFATRDNLKRYMPGRLVGVSHDAEGRPGFRLALQTREQHIRREKATSNICTAQVLLAVMASMYAVYHGPEGLRKIARRIHSQARRLAADLARMGYAVADKPIFDTIRITVRPTETEKIMQAAAKEGLNFRALNAETICISLDETTDDLAPIILPFEDPPFNGPGWGWGTPGEYDATPLRSSPFLTHPVFNSYHTETEMLRYIRGLEAKDLSLTHSMIPLGSCTMKLNATSEMFPVSWPEIGALHPFAPDSQTEGYRQIFTDLERWLAEITGFAAVSLQPNAGSQGEYAGLLAIRDYHAHRGEGHRDVCLIPQSAHGTNPASAAMAGFRVVAVRCLEDGDIDLTDLRAKALATSADLACLMITYPSTHGVFEEGIQEVCEIIHSHGGQVYMDGANMNAQAGLCRPGDFGADVCHLNLHKTFCIPHGGGGPGVGPIGVAAHLAPFLPAPAGTGGQVSAAPFGSASILVISWMYIRMMGADGLKKATETAILNANYIAHRLDPLFPVLFRGKAGLVAHECILDLRRWKTFGIEVEDVAKRLMDYGFHAPTVSWPVAGTMMIEPTESESRAELDRFCDAMIAIHAEMKAVETGQMDAKNNPLKRAPHTAAAVAADVWDRPYSRQTAAYPAPWLRARKFWPAVARIDNVYGDRNLQCSCPPLESFAETP